MSPPRRGRSIARGGRSKAAIARPASTASAAGPSITRTDHEYRPRRNAPVGVLTGPYGARVLGPLLDELGRPDVRLLTVENRFFGGNIGVTGLMVGEDIARVLAEQPEGHRYLLPDVCLSQDRFLDGLTVADLPRPVEVVPTDGASLRAALRVSLRAGAPA